MGNSANARRLFAEYRPIRIAAAELVDALDQIAAATYIGVAALTPAGRFYNTDRIREAAAKINGRVRLRVGGVILELGERRTRIWIDPKHATGDDEAIALQVEELVQRHEVSLLPSVAVLALLTSFMSLVIMAVMAGDEARQAALMAGAVAAMLLSASVTLFETGFRPAGICRANPVLR